MNHLNYSIAEAYYLAALHGYIPSEDLTTQSDILQTTQSSPSPEESTRGIGLTAVIFTACLMLGVFSTYVVQQKFVNLLPTQDNGITQQLTQPMSWKF